MSTETKIQRWTCYGHGMIDSDAGAYVLYSDVAPLLAKLDAQAELIKALDAASEFMHVEYNKLTGLHIAHGYTWPQEVIEEGNRLRAAIEAARAKA